MDRTAVITLSQTRAPTVAVADSEPDSITGRFTTKHEWLPRFRFVETTRSGLPGEAGY